MQNAANFDRAETSKANGSLMRATPIGVWGHLLTDEELAEIARIDCSLSHPNVSVCAAVAAYSIAIAELVGKPNATSRQAFDRAKAWIVKSAPDEVRVWMQEAENNVIVPYYPQPGFVRCILFYFSFPPLHPLQQTELHSHTPSVISCSVRRMTRPLLRQLLAAEIRVFLLLKPG